MALLIQKLQVKTLIIVPNLSLKQQLSKTLETLFGNNKNVVVENIDSSRLSNLINFDCIIWDEVHHGASATYHKLNKTAWTNIYYRFGFTATPFRNSPNEELLLQSIAGDVIYEVDYHQAVKDKAIVPVEAYFYTVPSQKCDGHTWAQVYSQLVVNNEKRNEIIALTLLKLVQADKSTLVLCKEIAHGQILSELTGIPFCNGQDNDSRRYLNQFNAGEIKGLIATTGVAGEGVDTKPCEFILIAGLGKAKSAFKQQVGRCVRTYPGKESGKVILLRDSSHKWTKAHYNAQKLILEQDYKVSPILLRL